MGKYMKKGKITGDVAVMEIPQSTTSLGVRTRARTLALQPNPELSYLQLRSRRLEKPAFQQPPLPPSSSSNPKNGDDSRANHNHSSKNPNNCDSANKPGSRVRVSNSGSAGSKKSQGRFGNFADVGRCDVGDSEEFHDLSAVEPSFGENNLDFDARERSTRESTPCSFIRDSENIGTPGSTSRPTCSAAANRRGARSTQRAIPTNPEMEEFFAGFELHQQKLFIEKYNYDIMNDMPLPGRYEWVRVDH